MKRADIRRIAKLVEPFFADAWGRHPQDHYVAYNSAWRHWLVEGGGKKALDDLYDYGGLGEPFARAVRREVLRTFGFRVRTNAPRLRSRKPSASKIAKCGTAVPIEQFQWMPGVNGASDRY
jgi:hypothetical protein